MLTLVPEPAPSRTNLTASALVLSWVMTRVLLTVFYFLVMTPFGLVMRLLGKRPNLREAATLLITKGRAPAAGGSGAPVHPRRRQAAPGRPVASSIRRVGISREIPPSVHRR